MMVWWGIFKGKFLRLWILNCLFYLELLTLSSQGKGVVTLLPYGVEIPGYSQWSWKSTLSTWSPLTLRAGTLPPGGNESLAFPDPIPVGRSGRLIPARQRQEPLQRQHSLLSSDEALLSPVQFGYSSASAAESVLSLCCCYCCCWVTSVVSDSLRPHGLQPTRLPVPGTLQAGTLGWAATSFPSVRSHLSRLPSF